MSAEVVKLLQVIFFSLLVWLGEGSATTTLPATKAAKQLTVVTTTMQVVQRVVDGDTIVLTDGSKVRYIGVDTPETVDPRKAVQCFGKKAKEYNAALVVGKEVKLEADVGNTDKYKRLLRYVYLPDGTMVNERLVREGYARVMTIPPNIRNSKLFLDAEREAREQKRGLWSACL